QASQFLDRVEYGPVRPDQCVQISAAHDAHHRPIALHVQVDVPVEVEDVEKLLQIVTCNLALLDQSFLGHLDVPLGHGPASVVTADRRPPERAANNYPKYGTRSPTPEHRGPCPSRFPIGSALLFLLLVLGT